MHFLHFAYANIYYFHFFSPKHFYFPFQATLISLILFSHSHFHSKASLSAGIMQSISFAFRYLMQQHQNVFVHLKLVFVVSAIIIIKTSNSRYFDSERAKDLPTKWVILHIKWLKQIYCARKPFPLKSQLRHTRVRFGHQYFQFRGQHQSTSCCTCCSSTLAVALRQECAAAA